LEPLRGQGLNGSAIPGTYWVKVDADTIQTKGGLRYDFDASGRIVELAPLS
jgi:hypothetical protein